MSKIDFYVADEQGACLNYPQSCWLCIYQGGSGQLCGKSQPISFKK